VLVVISTLFIVPIVAMTVMALPEPFHLNNLTLVVPVVNPESRYIRTSTFLGFLFISGGWLVTVPDVDAESSLRPTASYGSAFRSVHELP
jgi:hypothetical protein